MKSIYSFILIIFPLYASEKQQSESCNPCTTEDITNKFKFKKELEAVAFNEKSPLPTRRPSQTDHNFLEKCTSIEEDPHEVNSKDE